MQSYDAQFTTACDLGTHVDALHQPYVARLLRTLTSVRDDTLVALDRRMHALAKSQEMQEFAFKADGVEALLHEVCERARFGSVFVISIRLGGFSLGWARFV